ncbi:MAG TPA: glucokinase [Tepidisphaeraceae bacterium]|jgi:glucokinase
MIRMILAGDIGGTNCRLALFDEQLRLLRDQTFTNAGRPGLASAVTEFLAQTPERSIIRRACFGVAGPVRDGQVKLTNLDWKISEAALRDELKIPHVALINDLRAHAEGIALLRNEQLIVINPGVSQRAGNRAICAAGTGLGEAGLVWDDNVNYHHAVACEGGHCDFSPTDDREMALLEFLKQTGKPATWESVLSGPGLRNIYDFLITPDQLGPSAALPEKDPSPSAISTAALGGTNQASVAALDLFITLYGAEAGNLALKYLATGGVYLGGGIAPRIAARITGSPQKQNFLGRFCNKGPGNIQALLERMPIVIINSPINALNGAANHALRLLPAG